MAPAWHPLHLGVPLRPPQPPHLHHLRAVRPMSAPYRICPACQGFCFTGRDPNGRPKACRKCHATGRIYIRKKG